MKFLALVRYTMRETLSQKIMILLFAVLTVVIGLFVFTISLNAVNGVVESVSIYGSKPIASSELPSLIPDTAQVFIVFIFIATVVLCVITTAHVIPESLAAGTVVLFLSKPLSRASILLGRYCGVVLGIATIQVYFAGGLWIVYSLKTGGWDFSLLLVCIPLVLSFASMFALMTLLGVAFRSTGLVAAVAFVHATYLTEILAHHAWSSRSFSDVSVLQRAVGALYYILPQVADLRDSAVHILKGQPVFLASYIVAVFSGAVMLAAAVTMFRRMDF
ncbi:MAG: hypothetical protein HYR77_01455 [Ignavibacteria bacterium]|nr:hypothetical protein [Ignavibacteria bacterium]